MANNEFIKKATSLCRCFQLGLRVLHWICRTRFWRNCRTTRCATQINFGFRGARESELKLFELRTSCLEVSFQVGAPVAALLSTPFWLTVRFKLQSRTWLLSLCSPETFRMSQTFVTALYMSIHRRAGTCTKLDVSWNLYQYLLNQNRSQKQKGHETETNNAQTGNRCLTWSSLQYARLVSLVLETCPALYLAFWEMLHHANVTESTINEISRSMMKHMLRVSCVSYILSLFH